MIDTRRTFKYFPSFICYKTRKHNCFGSWLSFRHQAREQNLICWNKRRGRAVTFPGLSLVSKTGHLTEMSRGSEQFLQTNVGTGF